MLLLLGSLCPPALLLAATASALPMLARLLGQCPRRPALVASVLLSLIPSLVPLVDAEGSCTFPSRHSTSDQANPREFLQCTWNPVKKEWWCPITKDYERDKRWRRCPETFDTYAGNDPGNRCKIPFKIGPSMRHACIYHKDNDQPYWWCSTTTDYDRDQRWTKCKPHSAAMPCHFDQGRRGVHKQCALVHDKWICTTRHGTPRVCPETEKTFGGNDPGAECNLPFKYLKEEHYECVDGQRNSEGPYKWCGTTADYDLDRRWTRCKEGDMHKGLRFVIRIIIIAGGSIGGVIVVGCVLYYACDPISILQMTLRKRKPRPTNEVQLQTEDELQGERNPLTPSAPPPPSYEEAVCQRVGPYSEAPTSSEAPV